MPAFPVVRIGVPVFFPAGTDPAEIVEDMPGVINHDLTAVQRIPILFYVAKGYRSAVLFCSLPNLLDLRPGLGNCHAEVGFVIPGQALKTL